MRNQNLQTHSPEETLQAAADFAKQWKSRDGTLFFPYNVVALQGELGSGKTCFAKGVIHELAKVPIEEITSPTFTLVECYEVDPEISSMIEIIYHVDLYRLESPEELDALDWEDWLAQDALTLIEWPERFPQLFSHCQWQVEFVKEVGEQRKIFIQTRKVS